MARHIVYDDALGHVYVVIPSLQSGLTVEEVAKKDVPEGRPYIILDSSMIPSDRTFRMGWVLVGDRIEINMDKARDIKRDFLRKERQPRLEKLDVDYMLALEGNDSQRQKQIARIKKTLRDVTNHPAIDSAATPEELKALTLDGLII